jgi:hypothetical protein
MVPPFRSFGIGVTSDIAFEYAQLKSTNNIIKKEYNYLVRLPENMTASKLELIIWIAHTVPKLKKIRELSITESSYYDFMIDEYGLDETKVILDIYGNSDSTTCLAILLTTEESKKWRLKTHIYNRKNNNISRIDIRRGRGDVWRFIGH